MCDCCGVSEVSKGLDWVIGFVEIGDFESRVLRFLGEDEEEGVLFLAAALRAFDMSASNADGRDDEDEDMLFEILRRCLEMGVNLG